MCLSSPIWVNSSPNWANSSPCPLKNSRDQCKFYYHFLFWFQVSALKFIALDFYTRTTLELLPSNIHILHECRFTFRPKQVRVRPTFQRVPCATWSDVHKGDFVIPVTVQVGYIAYIAFPYNVTVLVL